MEWQQVITGLASSSPLAGLLGFIAWKLWTKVEQKDAELKALNQEMHQALIAVSRRSDED